MERLSGEFNRGYTKAILDVKEIFDYVDIDLRYHSKRMNQKLAQELLTVILENREKIREDRDCFIRWNCKLNQWECYEARKQP